MDDDREPERNQQKEGRRDHHAVHAHGVHQERGDTRAGNGTDRAADAEDREQSLALLFRVNVGSEAPKLSHAQHVENAGPKIKSEPNGHAHQVERKEQKQVRNEEQRDDRDQFDATNLVRQDAVEVGRREQEQRLSDRGVALDFCATREDERFSRGLDQVVRDQQEKDAECQEQRAQPLSGVSIRKYTEHFVERAARRVRGRVVFFGCGGGHCRGLSDRRGDAARQACTRKKISGRPSAGL